MSSCDVHLRFQTNNKKYIHFVVDRQRKTFQPCLVSNGSILSDKKILIKFFTLLKLSKARYWILCVIFKLPVTLISDK